MLTKEQLQEAATKYDLPVSMIKAVISVESGRSGFHLNHLINYKCFSKIAFQCYQGLWSMDRIFIVW
jgi:hypothetical protein